MRNFQVGKEVVLDPQQKYVLLPATFDPGEECTFVVSVFCGYPIQVTEIGKQTFVVRLAVYHL